MRFHTLIFLLATPLISSCTAEPTKNTIRASQIWIESGGCFPISGSFSQSFGSALGSFLDEADDLLRIYYTSETFEFVRKTVGNPNNGQIRAINNVLQGNSSTFDYSIVMDYVRPALPDLKMAGLIAPPSGKAHPPLLSPFPLQDHHQPQSRHDRCWAASLHTAFTSAGYSFTEDDFVNVLREECRELRSDGATLSQLIFAVTRLLRGRGEWLQEISLWGTGSGLERLNSPTAVRWSTANDRTGGLYLLAHSQDMMAAFESGAIILVGLQGDGYQHTSIVSEIEYDQIAGNRISIPSFRQLLSVQLLDPSSDKETKSYTADQLYKAASFVMAIHP